MFLVVMGINYLTDGIHPPDRPSTQFRTRPDTPSDNDNDDLNEQGGSGVSFFCSS